MIDCFKLLLANQHIADEIKAMERELSQTSMKLRQDMDEKLKREEDKKRDEAQRKEHEIMASDLADDEKEKLLKQHKAYTEKMEVDF